MCQMGADRARSCKCSRGSVACSGATQRASSSRLDACTSDRDAVFGGLCSSLSRACACSRDKLPTTSLRAAQADDTKLSSMLYYAVLATLAGWRKPHLPLTSCLIACDTWASLHRYNKILLQWHDCQSEQIIIIAPGQDLLP